MNLYFWGKEVLSRPALGLAGRLALAPLSAAAFLYGRGALFRRRAYRSGLVGAFDAGVPTISVGNLTVGGTGKTPCVEAVCRELLGLGLRPAVLSRGYGGTFAGTCAVVSEGAGPLLGANEAGDEPVLLAKRLPGVAVVVGRDRRRTAAVAVGTLGAQACVLDDGFQHLRLRRHADIVMIDATNPFGNGSCLPRGLLREPLEALADASLVVITRAGRVTAERLEAIRLRVREHNPTVPIATAQNSPATLAEVGQAATKPLSDLAHRKILAFAGIGNPAVFFQDLEALGARVLETVPFPDHHVFSGADVAKLTEWAGLMNAEALVTTEKDAMRLASWLPLPLPVLALGIELELLEGGEAFRDCIRRAVSPKGR